MKKENKKMKKIVLTIPNDEDFKEIVELLQNALDNAGFNANFDE
jgi:hypothetical protein